MKIEENVDLAPYTTMKIGGRARFFVRAASEDEVAEAVEYAETNSLTLFILGGGSNVLISDLGFDGLVLQIALKGINSAEFEVPCSELRIDSNSELETRNPKLITALAGEDWDKFVSHCVEHDLAGVECLTGIPGFVGGTPVQNVGAYGQEVSETIVTVRCLDRRSQEFVTLANDDCGFTYRTSIFNSTERDRYIVLGVTFALIRGSEPKIVYKDLIEHFGERQPSLSEVRDAIFSIRRAKSMVIDPTDPNSRSAGSFFKNPVVSKERLTELQAAFGRLPFFEFGDAAKIPAAWLIENAGFTKGYALGNAAISTNHTLALINRGDASAAEILALKNRIQETVETKFGIELQPEPVFVGF